MFKHRTAVPLNIRFKKQFRFIESPETDVDMTIRCVKSLLATVMASLLLALVPGELFAQYTLNWSCAGGMGSGTKSFSDQASCERERQRALSTRYYQPGGGCSVGECIPTGESNIPTYTPPAYDYEAERLRQEKEQKIKLKEQRKKEEEARHKQEEFEKNKADALENMKGITESEPGLKGVDADMKSLKGAPSGSLGLKGLPPEAPKLKEVSASSWISAVKDERNPCPGGLTSLTYFCGGGSNWPYVCCPKGAPYLNHCDCKCYSSSDFDCKSYSKCEPR